MEIDNASRHCSLRARNGSRTPTTWALSKMTLQDAPRMARMLFPPRLDGSWLFNSFSVIVNWVGFCELDVVQFLSEGEVMVLAVWSLTTGQVDGNFPEEEAPRIDIQCVVHVVGPHGVEAHRDCIFCVMPRSSPSTSFQFQSHRTRKNLEIVCPCSSPLSDSTGGCFPRPSWINRKHENIDLTEACDTE